MNRLVKILAAAAVLALAAPAIASAAIVPSIGGHGSTFNTTTGVLHVGNVGGQRNATVYTVDSGQHCVPVSGGGYSATNCGNQTAIPGSMILVQSNHDYTIAGTPKCGAIIQWDVYGNGSPWAFQATLHGNGNASFTDGALFVLPACPVVRPVASIHFCGDPGVRGVFDNSGSTVAQTFQMIYVYRGTTRTLTKTVAPHARVVTSALAIKGGSRVKIRIKGAQQLATAVAPARDNGVACSTIV